MGSRLRFGAAALVAVAGAVCVLVIGGVTGDAIGIGLIAIGLVGVVSLTFYEIGLSEDRDEERERKRRRQRDEKRRRLRGRRRP